MLYAIYIYKTKNYRYEKPISNILYLKKNIVNTNINR